MDILTDDYIIIIITCEKSTETILLRRLNNEPQNWCYAAIKSDSEHKIIRPNGNQCNAGEVQDFRFFLINAKCFKTEEGHQHCNGKINELINTIKSFNKSIILWTHERDHIQCNSIPICGTFHHGTNHHAEQFMGKICTNGNAFQKKFKELIEYSFKIKLKPHLIALSILCQGYLAAHGKECFKISDNELQKKAVANIVITENQNWWKPALGNDFNGTKLGEQLETVAEDKKTGIKCLIEIIKNKKDENKELYFDDKGKIVNNGITEKFTEKIEKAYGNLKKILGNC